MGAIVLLAHRVRKLKHFNGIGPDTFSKLTWANRAMIAPWHPSIATIMVGRKRLEERRKPAPSCGASRDESVGNKAKLQGVATRTAPTVVNQDKVLIGRRTVATCRAM